MHANKAVPGQFIRAFDFKPLSVNPMCDEHYLEGLVLKDTVKDVQFDHYPIMVTRVVRGGKVKPLSSLLGVVVTVPHETSILEWAGRVHKVDFAPGDIEAAEYTRAYHEAGLYAEDQIGHALAELHMSARLAALHPREMLACMIAARLSMRHGVHLTCGVKV